MARSAFAQRYMRPLIPAVEEAFFRGPLGLQCARGVHRNEVLLADPCGAVVDVGRLAGALVRAASRSGRLRVHSDVVVESVSSHEAGAGRDACHEVTTNRGSWQARHVVSATGAWTVSGLEPPDVRTKEVAALVVAADCALGDPLTYFVADDLFILPASNGEALVSFYCDNWDVDPAADLPTQRVLEQGTAALVDRLPGLRRSVVGLRAFPDSYAPGRLPSVTVARAGVAVVSGTSGSGVRLAPALAERAARMAGVL